VKPKKPITLKKPTKPKPTPTRQRSAGRTKADSPTPSVSATLHERIATRAFEIYERRIRQGPLDDWLQAEQEILRQKKIRNTDMLHPHRGGYAGEEQD
jgi:hypothetical protein